MSTKNLRETLLAKSNRRYTSIDIDGDVFWIRSLTELERSKQEASMINAKTMKVDFNKLPEAKLKMLCMCLVDGDTKEPLFEVHEWVALQALDARVIAKLYTACLEHQGYTDDDVEELVGN
jgi:hypothetical protein